MKLQIRRGLVVTATGASLLMGATAVQAAASWVHSSVPGTTAPLSAAELQQQLIAEQARSTALQGEVDALLNQAGQLSDALSAAGARVASDVQRAATMRAQLVAEEKQLAALKAAAAKAASTKSATATAPPVHATSGASGGSGGGDDGGD